MIELSSSEIPLYLVYYGEISDERLNGDFRILLNESEWQQALQFRFAKHRRRYTATQVLVRLLLSRYIPVRPEDWIFSTNENGRPTIVNAKAVAVQLSFNISHANRE